MFRFCCLILPYLRYGHEIVKQFNKLKPEIAETVIKVIPTATVVQQTSNQVLKFCLPFASQSKFSELFKTLEKEEGLQVIYKSQAIYELS